MMPKNSTRLDEMREQVNRFHEEHPDVWDLFVRFTLDRINRGFGNYSSKAIFERIRWETDSVGTNGISSWKLNNNYPAFYARRFAKMFPEHAEFFRTRKQTSIYDDPTSRPELAPIDYDSKVFTWHPRYTGKARLKNKNL